MIGVSWEDANAASLGSGRGGVDEPDEELEVACIYQRITCDGSEEFRRTKNRSHGHLIISRGSILSNGTEPNVNRTCKA